MNNTMTTMHTKLTSTRWMVLTALLLVGFYALASETIVTGLVRDARTLQPVNAARISSANDKASATTNEKGEFTIKINVTGALLHISAYEYASSEVAVKGRSTLIIDLFPASFTERFQLQTGLTGTTHGALYPGNIRTLNRFDQSISTSPEQELQLQLAGEVRSLSRSSATGMGNSTFIRGLNSLNANAQPLYVIDGVVRNTLMDVSSIHEGFYGNPLSYLSISDIESMSVLKDGTSYYGSKAANGVILINTKRGREMATKIDLRITGGITEAPDRKSVV